MAIETGEFQQALTRFGSRHKPRAIAVISAHRDSGDSVHIASADRHRLPYDFGAFPPPLYELAYPVAGDPALARRAAEMLTGGGFAAKLDAARPLDHGVWVPLRLLYRRRMCP